MKVVDYDIISGTRTVVAEKVKEKVKEGWQPFGSIHFRNQACRVHYAQAIAMYDDMPQEVKVVGTVETHTPTH
jgi:hypothetical protein